MDSIFDKEPYASAYNPNIYISILAVIFLYVIYSFYQYMYNKTEKKYNRKDSDDEYNMLILDENFNLYEKSNLSSNEEIIPILSEEFKLNDYYHKNFYRYF